MILFGFILILQLAANYTHHTMPRTKRSASDASDAASPTAAKRANVVNALEAADDVERGTLFLDDGTAIEGCSFGAKNSMSGEVVFNTGMVGYPEALSDPSYAGQILVLTFPLVGNYGVPSMELDQFGLPKNFESSKVQISGLIVSEYSFQHSHWNAVTSLGDWLKSHNVPALFGLDTRMITKKIREHGSMLGKIEFASMPIKIEDPNKTNLVAKVSPKQIQVFNKGASPKILAFDCGMKHNIVRYLAGAGVELTVVPFDYDLEKSTLEYDGIFISNGPGDPLMAQKTIDSIRWAINRDDDDIKPIFGICLGNQILALAAGAKTYKMKYGNRGMNQPCIDMRTTRCYITPQNHGYAVETASLPTGWKTFFMNANDHSNEGIIHEHKPFFSVQFHPEACGGPTDTAFLFDMFLEKVKGQPSKLTLMDTSLYDRPTYRKVLLLGSGGLSIGQAGEFDYSGSQAIKALKEEGIQVILVNPNIATVQTSKGLADKVYFVPVRASTVLEIIKKERPDGILVSMGGQTALNVGIELWESGALEAHNVRVMGTPISVVIDTEDRERFSERLAEIGETIAVSKPAKTIDEAIAAANEIGYPVLVRAAFALGGLGSGFAANDEELTTLAKKALFGAGSKVAERQILIDQDLRGWKEVEYEVVRDAKNNCITVCNMENFDPLGIHTGDSIVVAPSQTLSNAEYFKLRQTAQKVVRHLGIVGECNIQYALDPHSERYCIIEVNARLSRSSALASKATGYPLAYVAAKIALGIDLVNIKNSITKTTTACFEPSLDYCVVKMPRWDLKKFSRVSNDLGSSMLSVGEVMSVGRNFEECIQKAVRMVNPNLDGLNGRPVDYTTKTSEIDANLKKPTDERLFYVIAALDAGYSVDKVHELTKIDRWFLSKLHHISSLRKGMKAFGALDKLTASHFKTLKTYGFSDRQIATEVKSTELIVRNRRKSFGVLPFVKQIDTLAAEFPAQTNYLYMTYSGAEDDIPMDDHGVMVLGCGAYCIGSSVEFDWCAVSAVRTIRELNYKAIVVNYNPETVSTDYDESDRLYFEELSFERVLDIYDRENAHGVIVSVGGQIPNNLSTPLSKSGVRILGTSAESIDRCEDRNKFSALLDTIGVDQPKWTEVTDAASAENFASDVGFPVLVRPSYVLSGAGMVVTSCAEELRDYLNSPNVGGSSNICISKFILNAKEVEFDGVAKDGQILNYAISEHVENAGVHSGDATLVLPAQKLYVGTIKQVKRIASAIARSLNITGPFNIQLMAKENEVKVIECNLRASRTFPFISKTFDLNFINLATRAMLGLVVKPVPIALIDIDYVAVKAPQFSFTRLLGADPTLGVEMASTGEVACFGTDMHEAFLKALLSAGFKMPKEKKSILISIGNDDIKHEFLESCKVLDKLKYKLYGTPGTAAYLQQHGITCEVLFKPSAKKGPNVVDAIKNGDIELVINVPDSGNRQGASDGYLIRRASVDFGISLINNIKCAIMLTTAMEKVKKLEICHIGEYYAMPTVGWSTGKNLLARKMSIC
ncbi:aspartate carbamoyltransferase [Saprolegnia diclina VS20]|uniref:Aspartate carbamoyltransferase n=1 Tax=Saprolegnia diclina (strain VS20) TaxID=1156394 RepID=T0QC20_SAPDV|nr:aspartate carbamoyltransferase [Saprolegnia diclina VS20]EQC32261.1 aspartate carbamoyltransferase [Saprolegnia diclina VS20]|eukprot:XP_008614202.1 aspartate carbamoyltransferase [Saprolegnia diclina VS20]